MKKLFYIYVLSLFSIFFAHETNAGDPFNVKPWELEPEEQDEKKQDHVNTDNHNDVAENNDIYE